MWRRELTIAGVGGQGSILAGVIFGTAAVAHDGKFAVQTQAYSSELRGGFAAAWLVVSDEPVLFPRVIRPDTLVAQAQDAINRFGGSLREGGLLIYDSDMVSGIPDPISRSAGVPATSLARNELKAPVVANMIMLGALCRLNDAVSRPALEAAIKENVPAGKVDLNLRAFDMGFEMVRESGELTQ